MKPLKECQGYYEDENQTIWYSDDLEYKYWIIKNPWSKNVYWLINGEYKLIITGYYLGLEYHEERMHQEEFNEDE